MKRKMGFCGLLREKEMKEKGGEERHEVETPRLCHSLFFLTSVRALKKYHNLGLNKTCTLTKVLFLCLSTFASSSADSRCAMT